MDKLIEVIQSVYSDVLFHADDKRRKIIIDAFCVYYENESKKCGYPADLLCLFDDKFLDDVTI